jgi:hypothetical protein
MLGIALAVKSEFSLVPFDSQSIELFRYGNRYEPACTKLLAQYKSSLKHLSPLLDVPHTSTSTGEKLYGLEGWMRRFRMDCPAALHRLVVGVPATVEHGSGEGTGEEVGKWVAETTQVSVSAILHSNGNIWRLNLLTFPSTSCDYSHS